MTKRKSDVDICVFPFFTLEMKEKLEKGKKIYGKLLLGKNCDVERGGSTNRVEESGSTL